MARPLPASKLKVRRRKRRAVLLGLFVLLVLIFAGGAAALMWLPQVRITQVEVIGTESVAPSAVGGEVRDVLTGTYLGIVPRNNALVYPKEEVRARVAAAFPVFNTVEVVAKQLTVLTVAVVERAPEALWCGLSLATTSPCYLLDDHALAYAPAADFSGMVYTRYYGEATGTVPKQYLTQERYHSLFALVEELKTHPLAGQVTAVEVSEEGAVNVHFTSGFVLIFSLDDPGGDVLERLALALTAEPFASRALAEFEYLDLRFGDKLYYKLKGASQEEGGDSTLAE